MPRFRPTARLLVLDPADRVLLFSATDSRGRVWFTPGGGVHRGESLEAAAVRELAEETGHVRPGGRATGGYGRAGSPGAFGHYRVPLVDDGRTTGDRGQDRALRAERPGGSPGQRRGARETGAATVAARDVASGAGCRRERRGTRSRPGRGRGPRRGRRDPGRPR